MSQKKEDDLLKSYFNLIDDMGNEGGNLRAFFEKYRYYSKWFIAGLLLSLALAYVYLRYATNEYEANTTVIIDDKEKGGFSSELSAFQDLGLLGDQKSSLETEMTVLRSRTLMQTVVKNLDLTVAYFHEGRVREVELYNKTSPLKVTFLQKDSLFYTRDTSFSVMAQSQGTYTLQDAAGTHLGEKRYGEIVKSQLGDLVITPFQDKAIEEGVGVKVFIHPLKQVAGAYSKRLRIEPESKQSNALVLKLTDPIKRKAEDILNNLVAQYNLNAIEDKGLIAKNTDDFINQRILDISDDLENVDKGVEVYKTENKLTDIDYEAGLVLQTNSELEKQIVDLTSQIKLIDYVTDYMSSNTRDLIPSNLGLKDEATSQNTMIYNQLILERNRLIKGSSELNPTVVNMDEQIESLRQSINRSLINLRKSLALSLNEAKLQESRLDTRRAEAPRQEREFQDIKRRQQIIESLYLYLLQKREENAITLAATAPNAKIIDKADGDELPVAPNRRTVYMMASLLGLLLPFLGISLKLSLDNKIHKLEDVESALKAPILGDIPHTETEHKLIISESENSQVAESFRLLRTNVNFMLPKGLEGGKAIFVTSTVGSEGKTFVSINLAQSLTLINKKVLLIGADIRKPKISEYLDITAETGLTHYLIDHGLKPADVIVNYKHTQLDLIPSGVIPPNPSELLTNGRFEEVLAYGKKHYDFIIVDTAPVNVVTDTLLLGDLADLCIYVVRANFLDKRMLKIPQTMFENKRLPNMAILINDTDYGKKGYGYGYSYGYGYTHQKKPWWKTA